MSFKPLSYLEDAVKSKDIKDIRIAILSYIKKCLGDTKEIKDAINYIKSSLTDTEYNNIWEEHDGLDLDMNKNNWNKNYFSTLEVELSDNFSKERFNHILEVGKYVYGTTQPVHITTQSSNKNERKSSSNSSIENENKDNFLPKALVGGTIALIGISWLVKLMKK